MILAISNYLTINQLQQKQLIDIPDTNIKFGLYALDVFANVEQIEKLYQDLDVQLILFFAPVRYEMIFLKNSSLALDKNDGIINARGTIFPFVFKSERENPKTQLIAYQRLLKFQIKMSDKKDLYIEQQKLMIDTQNQAVNDKKYEMNLLMNAVQAITKYSIFKNPVKKYKTYKKMLSIYHKLSRAQ